jgi:hypothetical protein
MSITPGEFKTCPQSKKKRKGKSNKKKTSGKKNTARTQFIATATTIETNIFYFPFMKNSHIKKPSISVDEFMKKQ